MYARLEDSPHPSTSPDIPWMPEEIGKGPGAVPKASAEQQPAPDHRQPAQGEMDAATTVTKRSRSRSPNGDVSLKSLCQHPLPSSASAPLPGDPPPLPDIPPLAPAASTHPDPPAQPSPAASSSPAATRNPVIIVSSLKDRCFIHPSKVDQAVQASIFGKLILPGTLQVTGGGHGFRFEVVSLVSLSQTPESVTRMGLARPVLGG